MHGRIGNWKTKVDVFSLESLIAWLEKQPANAVYPWHQPEKCLLGQWAQSNGLVGADSIKEKSLELSGMPDSFGWIALCGDSTFSAALERARTVLASDRATL